MFALVTGAAGFIGSRLCERLAADGHRVRALDCLTPYYAEDQKRDNLDDLRRLDACEILEMDLRTAQLTPALDGIDVIFHQAGQPGVRASWSDGFESYVEHNVLATQRLLEVARGLPLHRLVYASSSSVYGDALSFPTPESALPQPQSPYGVTKLAAEHLCGVYARQSGVPTVSLRYFTVYGPRQRPDMAMHRLIEAGLGGQPFPMFGDGTQIRDFTFVDDVVDANLLAAERDLPPGSVLNIAGGTQATLQEVVDMVGELIGGVIPVDRRSAEQGDVKRTSGSVERARQMLGWHPRTGLREGMSRQVAWHERRRTQVGSAAG